MPMIPRFGTDHGSRMRLGKAMLGVIFATLEKAFA
jgi:hypothetical protein